MVAGVRQLLSSAWQGSCRNMTALFTRAALSIGSGIIQDVQNRIKYYKSDWEDIRVSKLRYEMSYVSCLVCQSRTCPDLDTSGDEYSVE